MSVVSQFPGPSFGAGCAPLNPPSNIGHQPAPRRCIALLSGEGGVVPVEVRLPPVFDLLRERARKLMAEHHLAEVSYPCRVRCLDGDWEYSTYAASLFRALQVRGVTRLPSRIVLHGQRGLLGDGRIVVARKDWSIRARDADGHRYGSIAVEHIAHAMELVS